MVGTRNTCVITRGLYLVVLKLDETVQTHEQYIKADLLIDHHSFHDCNLPLENLISKST